MSVDLYLPSAFVFEPVNDFCHLAGISKTIIETKVPDCNKRPTTMMQVLLVLRHMLVIHEKFPVVDDVLDYIFVVAVNIIHVDKVLPYFSAPLRTFARTLSTTGVQAIALPMKR